MKNLGSSQLASKKQVATKNSGRHLTGRYPDRTVHHCRNFEVTELKTWPSMPHFLGSEGLIRSHVGGVGNWDPIKGTSPLSPLGNCLERSPSRCIRHALEGEGRGPLYEVPVSHKSHHWGTPSKKEVIIGSKNSLDIRKYKKS